MNMPFFTNIILPIVVILVAGLIAGLSVRVNSYFQWLLNKRIEIFTNYLQLLDLCYDESIKKIEENSLDFTLSSAKVFIRLKTQAETVKILLPTKSREEFTNLSQRLYSSFSKLESKGEKASIFEDIEQVSSLFQKNLKLQIFTHK